MLWLQNIRPNGTEINSGHENDIYLENVNAVSLETIIKKKNNRIIFAHSNSPTDVWRVLDEDWGDLGSKPPSLMEHRVWAS